MDNKNLPKFSFLFHLYHQEKFRAESATSPGLGLGCVNSDALEININVSDSGRDSS